MTIKMITFDDIENKHVMLWAAANRYGGGVESRKVAIWVPHTAVGVDDIRAWVVGLRAGTVLLRCRGRRTATENGGFTTKRQRTHQE